MKKIYYFMIICLLMCVMAACGGSNKSSDGTEYQSYRDAIKNNDFEAARDTLSVYRDRYLAEQAKSSIWDWDREKRKTAEGKYYQAFDDIYKSETQYLLANLHGEECRDKIIFMLEAIPIEGEKFSAGLCQYRVAARGKSGEEGIPLDAYIIWTQHYNRLCSNILTLAINRKNQELARAILLQFVDNVEVRTGKYGLKIDGVSVDGDHGYIKYTSNDRDAAQQKYDNAVASGAFN